MFLYFFLRNWRFEYKQNARSDRKPSGRCLSETDICLRTFCRSGSSSGLRLPPLRTMPIHKIVSKERCQSYFIDGCRRIKIERNNLLCEQAPTEVFRSIFAWLVARLTFYLLRIFHNIFVLHEIIDQRYYGEDQCDPHNNIGEDL